MKSKQRQSGAALIMLTMMLATVMVPLVGLAIDGSIMFLIKTKLSASADASALAGARSLSVGMDIASQSASAIATAQAFFDANFPRGYFGTNVPTVNTTVAETAAKTRTVSVTATVQAPLYFMRILGRDTQQVQAAAQSSRRDVNLVMTLDRSSSMGGAMGPMLGAARSFTGMFAEGRDALGLIVFGGAAILTFPQGYSKMGPSANGPQTNFKSASPTMDTLISQTVGGGNTGMAQAIWMSYQELVQRNQPGALNVIVMFTDGLPNGVVANYNDPNPTNNFIKTAGSCAHRLDPAYPMLGFISQTSGFAQTGNVTGVRNLTRSTHASLDEGIINTPSGVTTGCSYASSLNNIRNDLTQLPPKDYYGNSLTGYKAVNLMTALTSPQQFGYAAMNATDNAVKRIRQDKNLNVVTFMIGYSGGSEAPDEVFMQRIANDPASPDYDPTVPKGLYIKAPTTAQLAGAFNRVASEILRLSM
jgi:Flp pilus assembly protein TadG